MAKPSRRSRGTATVEDVAQLAGVSAMTVSRVINDSKNVRESTRQAVLDAVAQLNYSPNAAARSLAAGEATHVGLLYANPSAVYLSQFLIGALEAARRAGCHLVIESCASERDEEQAQVARRFANSEVEGVILPPPLSGSPAILAEFDSIGIPVVTVSGGMPGKECLNVRIDDFTAAREMTRSLLDLGHRHIGFIKGHPNQISSHDRHRGFVEALREYGVDPAAAAIEQGYFTYQSGLEAAERLLSRPQPPSAIFASNDDMAAATVSVAHRKGFHIPDDLSIVGFDDTSLATNIWPQLTTVRQPTAEMAEAALDLLLADLRSRRAGATPEPAEAVLDHALVIRESSSAPRLQAGSGSRTVQRRKAS